MLSFASGKISAPPRIDWRALPLNFWASCSSSVAYAVKVLPSIILHLYAYAVYYTYLFMKDLYKKIRTSSKFMKFFSAITSKVVSLEKQGKSPGSEEIREEILKLLRGCDYNPAPLLPYMFPTYIDGEGLSMMNRPFGYAVTDVTPGNTITTRAGRQAAKSTSIGAKMLTIAHLLPVRQMYIAPHHDHVKTFARRLRELEAACRFQVSATKYKQNDNYKSYPKGGILELYHVYTDAVGIRGKTTDWITIDEAQSFDGDLMPEVHQVGKASKHPILNIMGTSLTVDTFLEAYYQDGSRGTWHIPLPYVNKQGERQYLDCGNRDEVISAIRERGLCCPHTGRRIDPRRGLFVHEFPTRMERGQVSLHVPQIIIPEYVLSPIKWFEIWESFLKYDRSKFLQEVIGIPTEMGSREITEQELMQICTLGSKDDTLKRARGGRAYRYIISGCDWGGSDYNRALKTKESYTVHAIIGVTHDRKIDILHLQKYSGMAYRDIIGDILNDHRRHRATTLGSDFGVGAAYNDMLREPGGVNPNRHMVFSYVGPKTAPVAVPAGEHMYNQFSLNRNESITELYKAIKTERIRCYNWEQAKHILSDCLNVTRVVHESEKTGEANFRYLRAGNKPDDCLHALNFAYVVARLILGEPLIGDHSTAYAVRSMLQSGSAPGFLDPPNPRAV